MSAVLKTAQARLEPLEPSHLDAVMRVEQLAYVHPWSEANFRDALQAGYHARMLMADHTLIGYYIAMKGVDEVHLLNITVAPDHQTQGWARLMLEALAIWSRGEGASWLWLEVRVGNLRAMRVYEAQGFRRVGQRKSYYPAGHGQREDAIVMGLRL